MSAISRSRLKADNGSIGVLTNPSRPDNLAAGDEAADLTLEQLAEAALVVNEFPTVGHAVRSAPVHEQKVC